MSNHPFYTCLYSHQNGFKLPLTVGRFPSLICLDLLKRSRSRVVPCALHSLGKLFPVHLTKHFARLCKRGAVSFGERKINSFEMYPAKKVSLFNDDLRHYSSYLNFNFKNALLLNIPTGNFYHSLLGALSLGGAHG